MLTETWLTKKGLYNVDIQGFESEHIFGNKSVGVKKGRYSGGVSIYYKTHLKDKIKIVEKNQCGIMWIKIQKELFTFEQDVFICCTYIPPVGSRVLNSDIDLFEQLELDITRYKHLGKNFLTGDLNSRTSNEPDWLEFDRYLDDEDTFLNDPVLQVRVNSDHVLDAHGRRLLLLCQSAGLLIANGRVHEDNHLGEHTFISSNGTSVVDYLLTSPIDMEYLSNFKILDFNEFSDHAPLFFSMATKTFQNTQSAKPATRSELKIVYDQSKAADFTSELMNNNEVLHRLTDCVNNSTVDSIVNSFTEYMYATAARVFGRETQTNDRPQPNLSQNKWFDA